MSVYLSMLEAGMPLIAVNLPSLWLLLTHVVPERVVRSMRSALSLGSQSRSHPDATTAATGSSTSRVGDKLRATSSTHSGGSALRSDLEEARTSPHTVAQQLRGDRNDQSLEAYAMHTFGDLRTGEQAQMRHGRIQVEHTVDLQRNEIPTSTR